MFVQQHVCNNLCALLGLPIIGKTANSSSTATPSSHPQLGRPHGKGKGPARSRGRKARKPVSFDDDNDESSGDDLHDRDIYISASASTRTARHADAQNLHPNSQSTHPRKEASLFIAGGSEEEQDDSDAASREKEDGGGDDQGKDNVHEPDSEQPAGREQTQDIQPGEQEA